MATARPTAITVFIIDDHELVRRGLRDLLGTAPDIEVVGEAASLAEARSLATSRVADVAVVDVRLPDGSGVDLCRELRAARPELTCLILTSYSDDEALVSAVEAGAAGFVLKQVLGQDLVAAVRAVAAGGTLLHPTQVARARERIAREVDPFAVLSAREREIAELVAAGLTNPEIAARTFLAEKTVRNSVSRILAKLGVPRRAHIVRTHSAAVARSGR